MSAGLNQSAGAAKPAMEERRRSAAVRVMSIVATSLPLRLFERKRDDAVASYRVIEESASCGRDYHVLLAIAALVRDGSGFSCAGQLDGPQLLAGLGIEGTEACIVGGAHEHQATGGCNG